MGAFGVPLGVLPLFSVLSADELAPLAISAAALAFASPIQDHIRSMFHLASKSWLAAVMSALHLLVTCAGLGLLSAFLPLWAPFGAMALGNLASLGFAGIMLRRIGPDSCPRPSRGELTSVGGWLLLTGLAKTGSGYVARVLLNVFVGVAALGFVEAARVVAQPLNVLALGLMAQVGPRITEASARTDAQTARRWRRRFALLLALMALPYIALTAGPWRINPLATLTPRAYEITGLTAAMLVAVTMACFLRPLRAELLGVRLQRVVTQVTVTTVLVEISAIFAGNLFGAYVVPLGLFLGALTGTILYTRRLLSVYPSASAIPARSML